MQYFEVVDVNIVQNDGRQCVADVIYYERDKALSGLEECRVTFDYDPRGSHQLAHKLPLSLVDEVTTELTAAARAQHRRNRALN